MQNHQPKTQFRDLVIVITGASSGIGEATARALAKRGACIVMAARRADQLYRLAGELQRQGGRVRAVPTDLRDRESIHRLIQTAIEEYGRVDVLINNAGVGGGSSINDDDERMEEILITNVLAPARCVQVVLPQMRKQGRGLIINIGSVAGEIGTSGVYSASKFGIRGFNDALRREVRRDKIAVVLIEPGFIRTEMTDGVKLPMPGPEVMANAIVRAIERPRRKMIVPWYYGPIVVFANLFPGLVDVILGSGEAQRRYQERRRR
jgi:short-subunit dehydrogenase